MYIESHIIEDNSQEVASKQWVKPALDVAIESMDSGVNAPA